MIVLKLAIYALAHQIGSWFWPSLMAYLHRTKRPRLIAYWMAFMLVWPAALLWQLATSMSAGERIRLIALIYLIVVCVPLACIVCVRWGLDALARRLHLRNVLPPDGKEKTSAPFLRRL